MADERSARPVSGEIMTGPDAGAAGERVPRGQPDDIVDADYEVLPRFATKAEPVPPAFAPASIPSHMQIPSLEGMDMLRKPDAAPQRPPVSRGGPIFWIFGVGIAFAAFWISGGNVLVRHAPFLAAGQDAGAALSISGVTSRVDVSGPVPVLFVDGEAGNDGAEPATLPALEIQVAGSDGRIARYRLGTSARPLGPGERFAFSSRLDMPRNGVKTVSVTFAE